MVFSKKELGDGGLRFLARMRESQMFCNYCHSQSLKRRSHRQHGDRMMSAPMTRSRSDQSNMNNHDNEGMVGNSNGNGNGNGNAVERCRSGESGPRSGSRYQYNNDMKSTTMSEKSYGGFGQGLGLNLGLDYDKDKEKDKDKDKDDEDCLVTLFKIMLTGTIPLKQNKISELIATYERDEARLRNESSRSSVPVPLPVPIPSYFSPIFPSSPVSISYKHLSRSEKYKNCGNNTNQNDYNKEILLEDSIVWCNGRCNGAANTPLCSSICLKIWDERVLKARKILNVKQVIARQHHSGLIILSYYLSTFLSISLPTYLPAYLPAYLTACLLDCLPTYLPKSFLFCCFHFQYLHIVFHSPSTSPSPSATINNSYLCIVCDKRCSVFSFYSSPSFLTCTLPILIIKIFLQI